MKVEEAREYAEMLLAVWIMKKMISVMVTESKQGEKSMLKLEKAWDLKALAAAAKEQGLEVAEEQAKVLAILVLDFVDQSVSLTPTPMDDLAKVAVGPAKNFLLALADKIDGEVG